MIGYIFSLILGILQHPVLLQSGMYLFDVVGVIINQEIILTLSVVQQH